jgi:hypothetical protein
MTNRIDINWIKISIHALTIRRISGTRITNTKELRKAIKMFMDV